MIQTEDMEFAPRIISPETTVEDSDIEVNLRPQTLHEYIGQDKVKENLAVYIEAAKRRGEPLDHVLLYGPPGLGKTTLSAIIAHELGVNLRVTTGPAIEKPGDLVSLLTSLSDNDVLFIDEIHRLSHAVEEILQRPVFKKACAVEKLLIRHAGCDIQTDDGLLEAVHMAGQLHNADAGQAVIRKQHLASLAAQNFVAVHKAHVAADADALEAFY